MHHLPFLVLKSEGRESEGGPPSLFPSSPSSLRCVTYMLTYYLAVRISGRWLREERTGRALPPETIRLI